MKKVKIFMAIMGFVYLINYIIVVVLLITAIVYSSRSKLQDASFCLLWAIVLHLFVSSIRDQIIDWYNDFAYRNKKDNGYKAPETHTEYN